MKDEIKEILEYLKALANSKWIMLDLSNEDFKMLYDYITNLQEENERLRKDYGRLMQNNAYTLELEQRNEKAIEYIKEHRRADLVFKLYLTEQETDNVLNILQGGDK